VSAEQWASDDGNVSVGGVRLVVRTGPLAKQFQDLASRIRAEIRHSMDYLARQTRGEMSSRAPHKGGDLQLNRSISATVSENDKRIKAVIRPRGQRRRVLAAYVLEGGFSGTVRQHVRRPPRERARTQASIASRAKLLRSGSTLVQVGDYRRAQAAQPFVGPTLDAMAPVAIEVLNNAVARATRGS